MEAGIILPAFPRKRTENKTIYSRGWKGKKYFKVEEDGRPAVSNAADKATDAPSIFMEDAFMDRESLGRVESTDDEK